MSSQHSSREAEVRDQQLIDQIRSGNTQSWSELISRYEGRLLAYVESRLTNRSVAEDIVQETLLGFLTSLPNFDGQRSLESYLFSICAYKLTDHLRREGRRPTIPLSAPTDTTGYWEISGGFRVASSIARSAERQRLEEAALVQSLRDQVDKWRERGDWTKLKCVELLVVKGMPNKEVAEILQITEQQVANFKFDFLARTRALVQRQDLSQDIFPELYQDS
ncbi:MAG TPA: RNA polymerase sigma factor [Pirellulaceae bacterium]|nr:RNA polymerase sigma factor [Pirellulaceae bacterium]